MANRKVRSFLFQFNLFFSYGLFFVFLSCVNKIGRFLVICVCVATIRRRSLMHLHRAMWWMRPVVLSASTYSTWIVSAKSHTSSTHSISLCTVFFSSCLCRLRFNPWVAPVPHTALAPPHSPTYKYQN